MADLRGQQLKDSFDQLLTIDNDNNLNNGLGDLVIIKQAASNLKDVRSQSAFEISDSGTSDILTFDVSSNNHTIILNVKALNSRAPNAGVGISTFEEVLFFISRRAGNDVVIDKIDIQTYNSSDLGGGRNCTNIDLDCVRSGSEAPSETQNIALRGQPATDSFFTGSLFVTVESFGTFNPVNS